MSCKECGSEVVYSDMYISDNDIYFANSYWCPKCNKYLDEDEVVTINA